MIDQLREREEIDKLNREVERQDRPCLLCTEQPDEKWVGPKLLGRHFKVFAETG